MDFKSVAVLAVSALFFSCADADNDYVAVSPYPNVSAAFGNAIDLDNLYNYENQFVPDYITRDNTTTNPVTDKGATLGRVLFYDKSLSSTNTVSCASCHIQSHAFGNAGVTSVGVNGNTARHTMRLVNARYGIEQRFFWDERAETLELQTTQPIQNHAEMGYSGQNGNPGMDALIAKLQDIGYYRELFAFVYGDDAVTENRLQLALAQFVRSITSFDSKYDTGRAMVENPDAPFPNFTAQENQGKLLFGTPPIIDNHSSRIGGGLGCVICHAAPEFDIDPNSGNNGIIGSIGAAVELDNTRAPSLRDLMKPDGTLNGPLMHTGQFTTIDQVLAHYNQIYILPQNPNLDHRLVPIIGSPQRLNMTPQEIDAVKAFLKTIGGTNVYTDRKWASPFQ